MSQYNALTLKVYSSGTTEAQNTGLENAERLQFSQVYPGGKCAGMTFYVPRDVTSNWSVSAGLRIAAYNGLNMVWDGYITGITPTVSADRQGVNVIAEGAWSHIFQQQKTRKPWANTHMDEATWDLVAGYAGNEKATIDRQNRIRITPKAVAWTNTDNCYLRIVVPTGQTVKRITLNYDLQEAAQNWSLIIYNVTGATNLLAVTTSNGTPGTRIAWDSGTIATPSQIIYFGLSSGANQTPASDGSQYADIASVVVYTEIGSINAQEITKDIAGLVSGISTDVSQIGAETFSLVPFIANGAESYADLLSRAAGYGDASFNKWAAWVDFSANASDCLPRLVLEQQPVLTAYDYAIRMDDQNVSGDLQFIQDLDPLRNWIAVQYNDVNGRAVYVTPDDDATLKDATSITTYGQRDEWITLNTTSLTAAKNYAKRFLAARKDLQWTTVGQIAVVGYIRGANGQPVPSSQVQPGKRVKVENWLNDLSGTGLTFLITGTAYTDSDEKCSIDIGLPNTLETTLLRLQE